MTVLRSRVGAVLAKIESSEGVDASPAAADAINAENVRISFDPSQIDTNEFNSSLDPLAPVVGGMKMSGSFDVYAKGSGTPGTAPDFGKLFKACGWEQVLTATTVPSGTPQLLAAGSTTTATLGASASATAQAYRGMPLALYRNSGSDPDIEFVSNYTTGKVATLTGLFSPALAVTDEYQVQKSALYRPTSDQSLISSFTLYFYMDGVLYKMLGCRGTFTHSVTAGGVGKFSFSFTGIFSGKTDASVPDISGYVDATRPPVWRNPGALSHRHGVFSIDRSTYPVRTFSFDNGTPPAYVDNPNNQEGFDPAVIVRRMMKFGIDPLATLVATRDMMTTLRSGATHLIHARWGDTAGNRVAFVIPTGMQTQNNPGDRDGLLTEEIQGRAVGQDAGALICFW